MQELSACPADCCEGCQAGGAVARQLFSGPGTPCRSWLPGRTLTAGGRAGVQAFQAGALRMLAQYGHHLPGSRVHFAQRGGHTDAT